MKKLIAVLLAGTVISSLSGCTTNSASDEISKLPLETESQQTSEQQQNQEIIEQNSTELSSLETDITNQGSALGITQSELDKSSLVGPTGPSTEDESEEQQRLPIDFEKATQVEPAKIEELAKLIESKDEKAINDYIQSKYLDNVVNMLWNISTITQTMFTGIQDFDETFKDMTEEDMKTLENIGKEIILAISSTDIEMTDLATNKIKQIAGKETEFNKLSTKQQSEMILILLEMTNALVEYIEPKLEVYQNEFAKRGIEPAKSVYDKTYDEFKKELTIEMAYSEMSRAINDMINQDTDQSNSTQELDN